MITSAAIQNNPRPFGRWRFPSCGTSADAPEQLSSKQGLDLRARNASGSRIIANQIDLHRALHPVIQKRFLRNTHEGRNPSCRFLLLSNRFVILSRMTVTIPDDLIGNMQLNEQDVLVDIAIGLYKREQVSLGRAAEIANMSSPAFLDELGRRKIPINYDINDLHADLASLRDTHCPNSSKPNPLPE